MRWFAGPLVCGCVGVLVCWCVGDGDVSLAVAVLAVQLVDVGPLQPVREESQQVGGEVEPLQAHQAGALTGPANTPLSSAAPGFEMNQSGEAAD